MIWALFALFSAFMVATQYMLVKRFVKDIDPHILGSGTFLTAFVFLFTASLIKGFPVLGPNFLMALLGTGILNVVATIIYYKALKITDLSLAAPMLSFTPVFLILTSLIILGEFPTLLGIIGILLIVGGSYILNISKHNRGLLAPFKQIFRDKGVLFVLLVAFIYSITTNFDKMLMLNSDPVFSLAVFSLFVGLSLLIVSFARKLDVPKVYKKNIHKFFLIGLTLALSTLAINLAYTMQIVPYVISLKRLSLLFSVVYGGLLFKEKNILPRSIGAAVMIGGVVLIILF
ncbi:hypothetical protein AYK26_02195 [Euryarchaeota archaeon SM23-78]|nr:MAG: hypothetical protein AYK26_02195 [Euryarchaeota archaeon SM23-78]MBW3000908.1 DMT family transporter [Candidatus Woesearchaeota archaeon]